MVHEQACLCPLDNYLDDDVPEGTTTEVYVCLTRFLEGRNLVDDRKDLMHVEEAFIGSKAREGATAMPRMAVCQKMMGMKSRLDFCRCSKPICEMRPPTRDVIAPPNS